MDEVLAARRAFRHRSADYYGATPVQHEGLPAVEARTWGSRTPPSTTAATTSFLIPVYLWKTPLRMCGNGQNDCTDYNAWTTEVDGDPEVARPADEPRTGGSGAGRPRPTMMVRRRCPPRGAGGSSAVGVLLPPSLGSGWAAPSGRRSAWFLRSTSCPLAVLLVAAFWP